jgi:protein-S-isoprenylcysteine O-methyltransferase Ste14
MNTNASNQSKSAGLWCTILRVAVIYLVILALFFGLAGRLDWYAGWALLLAFIGYVSFLAIWTRRHDPELAAERTSTGEGVKRWDQIIMVIYSVLLLAMLAVSILDGGRFRWTHLPAWLRALGWMGIVFSGWMIWRVMKENTFLSEHVRIQSERGHKVITTGPYGVVRHPMYVGIITGLLGVPLVLGSLYGFWIAIPTAALFVVRTALEDRTLMEELPGYPEYAQRTRWRLIPFIW